MAFFIKKIAEIFDQAGIGYAVNQHTIGFGHQFGAGFGKRRQLAAQDIQRPNKQKIKAQHCQGQRNVNVENKGKTDDNGNRRRNEPPENVVINAVTVIDNGFDFSGNIAGHFLGKKRRRMPVRIIKQIFGNAAHVDRQKLRFDKNQHIEQQSLGKQKQRSQTGKAKRGQHQTAARSFGGQNIDDFGGIIQRKPDEKLAGQDREQYAVKQYPKLGKVFP